MKVTVPFADLGAMTAEIRPRLDAAWSEMLATSQFVGGAVVERFEQEWADYCGTRHAVGVANGTDSLHLILRALGVGAGDEVVLPTNTFVATAEAVVLAGATPRFADVDPDTLLLSAAALESALTPRTRAVIVVHLYGQVADMTSLMAMAQRHGLLVIEDAAQAHGSMWRGRRAGSFGVAGSFSFYPGKNLGAFGDGGAIVTNESDLAQRVRSLRDHGRAGGSHYEHTAVGMNSRLDAIQAAVLSAKLERLDAWTEARRAIVARYRESAGPEFTFVAEHPDAVGVYHLAVVRHARRDEVRAALASRGIQTGVHYPTPCHLAEPYVAYATGPLPVAERAAREQLSLPLFPHMTEVQIDAVCDALRAMSARRVERAV